MNTRKLGGGIDIYDLLHGSGSTKAIKKVAKPQSNSKSNTGRNNISPQKEMPTEYFSSYDSEANMNLGESSDTSTQSKIAHLTQLQSILATKSSIIEELEEKLEACKKEQKEMEANLFYKNSMHRKSLESEMIALKNGVDEEDLDPEQLYSIIKTSDEMIMTLINENDQLNELFNQKVGLEVEIAGRIDILEQRLAEKEKSKQNRRKLMDPASVYEDFERRLGEIVAENESLMTGKKNLTEENKKLQEYVERLTKTAKDQAKAAANARLEALYERMQKIEASNQALEAEARAKTQKVEKLLQQIDEVSQEMQSEEKRALSRRESGFELSKSTQKSDKVAIIGINLTDSQGVKPETQNSSRMLDEMPLSMDSASSSRRESLLNNKERKGSKSSIPAPFSPVKRMNLIRKESSEVVFRPTKSSPTKYIQRENGQAYIATKEEVNGYNDNYSQSTYAGKKNQSPKLPLQENGKYSSDNLPKSSTNQFYKKNQVEFYETNQQYSADNYQLPKQTRNGSHPSARFVDYGHVVSDLATQSGGDSTATSKREFYKAQDQVKRTSDNFETASNLPRTQNSAISTDYAQKKEEEYYYYHDYQKNNESDYYRALPYNAAQNVAKAQITPNNYNDQPAQMTDAPDSDRKVVNIDLSDFQPPPHINMYSN